MARTHRVRSAKTIRHRLGPTQPRFADRFPLPLGTLRDWERGARTPNGPARTLLRVIEREPEAVLRALDEPPVDRPAD